MPRQEPPPTALKAWWMRIHRLVLLVLVVAAVAAGFLVSFAIAVLLAGIALGLATFTGGGPAPNGPQSPPSVPPYGV